MNLCINCAHYQKLGKTWHGCTRRAYPCPVTGNLETEDCFWYRSDGYDSTGNPTCGQSGRYFKPKPPTKRPEDIPVSGPPLEVPEPQFPPNVLVREGSPIKTPKEFPLDIDL